MLDPDMRSYYHHQDPNAMSTQTSQNDVPVMDPSIFLTRQGLISDDGMFDFWPSRVC